MCLPCTTGHLFLGSSKKDKTGIRILAEVPWMIGNLKVQTECKIAYASPVRIQFSLHIFFSKMTTHNFDINIEQST